MAATLHYLPTAMEYPDIKPLRRVLPPPKVFLQDTCAKHQFVRSRDLTGVYERPERLKAAYLGVAAAYSRLETAFLRTTTPAQPPFEILTSAASVKFDQLAVTYVHGQEEGSYLANLSRWAAESKERIAKGQLEIPDSLKDLEDDLYLCPESVEAFQGGLGTVCEAIDAVATADEYTSRRAFVVIRPPGHHCGEDSPCGFCFVNGIAVGAAHAYIEHALSRVVIFDIDLHHGNGTQEITSQLNSESWRDRHEKQGVRVFYGSIHDIGSFPCENAKEEIIADASRSVNGVEGQWIENVHLRPYKLEPQFWDDYEPYYSRLFARAAEFIHSTGGTDGDDVIVLMSCGFDASEHESPAMNRHGCKVPTGFYHRFTRDACKFAEKYASGRLVSVMEGGYDDKALVSGALSHVCGLVDRGSGEVDPRWWDVTNVQMLSAQLGKRRGRKPRTLFLEPWLQRSLQIAPLLDGIPRETHRVAIPAPLPPPPKPTSTASVGPSPLPRKRGRPRKLLTPDRPATSSAPPEASPVTYARKRSNTGGSEPEGAVKHARPNHYLPYPALPAGAYPAAYPANLELPNAYANLGDTLNDQLSLRWQTPNMYAAMRGGHHPVTHATTRIYQAAPTMMAFRIPAGTLEDYGMVDAAPPRVHVAIVDLGKLWPKGQLSPGILSGASSSYYKCHTHYEPDLGGWGVRSIKGTLDAHCCYVPNRYKNALRFLNYRVAQLAQASEVTFYVPRSQSTQEQRQAIRDLKITVQRMLVFHHNVRERILGEIRDKCYGGRDPTTTKPSGSMAVRLPTMDTWLLHMFLIENVGMGHFNAKKLDDAAKAGTDPLQIDWEAWANSTERQRLYGFDFPPSEREAASHKEAGILENPVVEGITVKADWYKRVIEARVKAIREGA